LTDINNATPDEQTMSEEADLIASVLKNSTTSIQIRRVTYKGANYYDIREFVESETYQGPTRKGIRVRSDIAKLVLEPLMRDIENLESTSAAF
jgi:hypothetical protein